LQNDVIPLLEEYCYEDFDILKEIIGKQFVDKDNQQIKHSCFEEDTGFIESLNEAFENINKTAGALKTSVATDDETDDETV
jgi:5-methylcytosine-specific restriction protein B